MWMLIIQFLVLQCIFFGVIIFFLRRTFLTSTEGAVQRLNKETEEARTKQAELDRKIKEANEELEKRKKEAGELAKKMIDDADTKAKDERDKILKKARDDGEDIISKAQRTRDQMRKEIEREQELKTINFAADLISAVLSEKAREALNGQLAVEFIENLKKVDMNQIGSDVRTAEIITAVPLDQTIKTKAEEIIKQKLARSISLTTTIDPKIIGGVILRFGSLALDASLQNFIAEASISKKEKAEGA